MKKITIKAEGIELNGKQWKSLKKKVLDICNLLDIDRDQLEFNGFTIKYAE